MFGISFWELLLIGLVALLVVGPEKLPKMLGTLGRWSNKLRRLTTEVRQQTGIDDLLRENGIQGGLDEIRQLRSIVKGNVAGLTGAAAAPRVASANSSTGAALKTAGSTQSQAPPRTVTDIYAAIPGDRSREYPEEGCDAYGCLSDDLWTDLNREAFDDETELIRSGPLADEHTEDDLDSSDQDTEVDSDGAESPQEASEREGPKDVDDAESPKEALDDKTSDEPEAAGSSADRMETSPATDSYEEENPVKAPGAPLTLAQEENSTTEGSASQDDAATPPSKSSSPG